MPLLDHFHPPLREQRHWESFHAAWLGSLADALNRQLPPGYFAEEQTHAGASIEIDLATFEDTEPRSQLPRNGPSVAVAAPQLWSPPAPAASLPAVFANDFEVRVFATRSGIQLVAALELISPANKDRPEARRGFAGKCASYLYQSVSLIVIDIVTERQANLHNDILQMLGGTGSSASLRDTALYAAAYRPIRRGERNEVDIWPETLAVGAALPVLPLALNAEICLPVNLEATYMDARQRRRL